MSPPKVKKSKSKKSKNDIKKILKNNVVFFIIIFLIILYLIGNTFLQQNTIVYWILLITSFVLTKKVTKSTKLNIGIKILIFIGFYFLLFATLEFMDIYLGISFWNQTERTSNCYDWWEKYLTKNYDKDFKTDLIESYFDGNYNLTPKEANINKYNYLFDNLLELKPGMKLLDLGCGEGTWILYCKKRGVETVGLTLSPEQEKAVKKKGLEVYVQDYRIENKNFINSFDRITLNGTIEHNCNFTGIMRKKKNGLCKNTQKCNNTRVNLFKLCRKYLKKDGKMFIAGIVLNENYKFTNYDYLQGYIMERHFGGRYSRFSHFKKSLEDSGFKIDQIKDTTTDYAYTPIIAKDHFGCWKVKWHQDTLDKCLYLLKGFLTDPFLMHRWIYYNNDTWQWQFGTSCSYKKPLTKQQVNNAPAQNKWFLCSK